MKSQSLPLGILTLPQGSPAQLGEDFTLPGARPAQLPISLALSLTHTPRQTQCYHSEHNFLPVFY